MNHATQRRPRGHARWQWCVAFAAVNGPPWFNRHFLVQWTALWVIRIPLLPAVALPYRIIWMKESPACVRVGWGGALEGLCAVRAVVSDQGRLYNPHTHTHVHKRTWPQSTCQTYRRQISRPHLPLSIHVYLTETRMAFLSDGTGQGCHSQEHYFWQVGLLFRLIVHMGTPAVIIRLLLLLYNIAR